MEIKNLTDAETQKVILELLDVLESEICALDETYDYMAWDIDEPVMIFAIDDVTDEDELAFLASMLGFIPEPIVEAKTQRIQLSWSFDYVQAQAQQSVDVEAEIMAALAQEITAEIDADILATLRAMPPAKTAEQLEEERLEKILSVSSEDFWGIA